MTLYAYKTGSRRRGPQPTRRTREIRRLHREQGLSAKTLGVIFGLRDVTIAERLREGRWEGARLGERPPECSMRRYKGFCETIEPILRKYRVSWAQYMGVSRAREIVLCRRESWAALRDAGFSFYLIGKFCGKDHTTIIHGDAMARTYWGA